MFTSFLKTKRSAGISMMIMLLSCALFSCVGTVSGIVQVRNPDGSLGDPIEGADVIFTKQESGILVYREISSASGRYSVEMETGRYTVNVNHPNYNYISSPPNYLIVEAGANTANMFMEPAN